MMIYTRYCDFIYPLLCAGLLRSLLALKYGAIITTAPMVSFYLKKLNFERKNRVVNNRNVIDHINSLTSLINSTFFLILCSLFEYFLFIIYKFKINQILTAPGSPTIRGVCLNLFLFKHIHKRCTTSRKIESNFSCGRFRNLRSKLSYNGQGYGVVADLEARTYRITKNLDKWTKL